LHPNQKAYLDTKRDLTFSPVRKTVLQISITIGIIVFLYILGKLLWTFRLQIIFCLTYTFIPFPSGDSHSYVSIPLNAMCIAMYSMRNPIPPLLTPSAPFPSPPVTDTQPASDLSLPPTVATPEEPFLPTTLSVLLQSTAPVVYPIAELNEILICCSSFTSI